ncbi:M43 family zinc metalloprotease [Neolewinella antarctica]|uniref:Peptidase M43 pregnancy-associated plasma-A domain-containing protein n=1 Tax=Neolewinella antarctica TaxID=442734 RepID=A0ABX0XFC3_9BACT|nr:M43 family zinc metalloprotease [Neolewinella antarctica]NJC27927.1 hypothetical protein [Neolewinella antarctica]
MRSVYFPLLLFPLLIFACRSPLATPQVMSKRVAAGDFEYVRHRFDSIQRPLNFEFPRQRNYDNTAYLPDTTHADYLPVRNVLLNFHVMNSADTVYDFYGAKATEYITYLLSFSNKKFNNNPRSWLQPDSMDVPALPTRIQFKLATDPATGRPAIYEHYDDELYDYRHDNPGRNRGDMAVVKKYAVRTERELNIFLMGPPWAGPQPVGPPSPGSGIFLGDAVKLTDPLSGKSPAWELRKVFTHEVGHALGLWHAWGKSDGCDDTPAHANLSWKLKKRGPGVSSNNLMDYSPNQEALTPCQIGRMQARMADPTSKQRRWVRRDWCEYRPEKRVVIDENVTFDGARDFNSDVLVRAGFTLTVNNRFHLPLGAKILVEPGARLVLGPDAILHNDCGDNWGGVEVGVLNKTLRGEVVADPRATVLNETT